MDGLPKNKKPWGKAKEPTQIALDDYLFGRKLQEVYDKKQASNDMPLLLKKAAKQIKKAKLAAVKVVKRKKKVAVVAKAKRPVAKLIDAPHIQPKKFAKLQNKQDVLAARAAKKAGRSRKLRLRVNKKITAVAALALVVGGGVYALQSRGSSGKKDAPTVAGAVSPQKPDFDTLKPTNGVDAAKIKFDPTKRVATFEDKIEGKRVVISQQKLGETELKDADFLKRTATNFNLKDELVTRKGTAYIGTNIDKNVQICMFIYKDFLLFIQTETTYKNQTMVDYIDNLQ
jgi:hypothetical protein